VEGKSAGESTWRTLSTAVTNAEGRVEKRVLLGKSTTIRIVSDASWERSEGSSVEMPVTIKRLINITAPTSIKSATQFQISGAVIPRTVGASVTIEKLVGNEWKAIAEPVSTDAQGNFAVMVAAQTRGVLTLRAIVSEDANWAALTGQTFNIIIR
jgi:5-hydroxyisourate hydrolase-like protein (transthyretin family)